MQKNEFIINTYSEDHLNLVSRLLMIFSRRRIVIKGMQTSVEKENGKRRMTIVIEESEENVKKLVTQIEKQIDVLQVRYLNCG